MFKLNGDQRNTKQLRFPLCPMRMAVTKKTTMQPRM